jgi:hypothetical protein
VKAILEFTLPDDDWDFRVARCGVRFLQAWSELKRQVRQKKKHGEMPKEVYAYVDELYTASKSAMPRRSRCGYECQCQ